MVGMFLGCSVFNESLENWDVSCVQNMAAMLSCCSSFNQSLANWNVSNVTNMRRVFFGCTSFNQDLSSWDISQVHDMTSIFEDCVSLSERKVVESWEAKGKTAIDWFGCFLSSKEKSQLVRSTFESSSPSRIQFPLRLL